MGIKLSSQSQTRILLFVVITIGTIVSIASGSLYLIYNDSHEQIQSLNAVYQENNSSIDFSKAIELVALVDTPIPNKTGSSIIKISDYLTKINDLLNKIFIGVSLIALITIVVGLVVISSTIIAQGRINIFLENFNYYFFNFIFNNLFNLYS